jgi:hypothetical protein
MGRFLFWLPRVSTPKPQKWLAGIAPQTPGRGPGMSWLLTAGSMVLGLHPKAFTEIELSADWIVNQKFAATLALDPAIVNKIGAVHNFQCFPNVVICNQDC